MKNILTIILLLLFRLTAFGQSSATNSAAEHITIEFLHPCLLSHRPDTAIVRGLPAGATCQVSFDQGPVTLKDSICILLPHGDSLGNYWPKLFGGQSKHKVPSPGRIDSGLLTVYVSLPSASGTLTLHKSCCIQLAVIDTMVVYWDIRGLRPDHINKMTRSEVKLMLHRRFNFSLKRDAYTYKFHRIVMNIPEGQLTRSLSAKGNLLSASMMRALKKKKTPFTFNLVLYKAEYPSDTINIAVKVIDHD